MGAVSICTAAVLLFSGGANAQDPHFQYKHGDITIPKPSAAEPRITNFALAPALEYLDKGALAWARDQKCISCHTTGTYLLVRPQLPSKFGKPSQEIYDFFLSQLEAKRARPRPQLQFGSRSVEMVYLAAGLAEWDAHISGALSPATEDALHFMFELQLPSGTWKVKDCWPPLESSPFHSATIAALAVATAPGWLVKATGDERASVERLKEYLRSADPQNDYDRVSLLWAAAKMPGLLADDMKQTLIEMVFRRQRTDGGWSLRAFSAPEKWGSGLRAERLHDEPDADNPPSDGHMTGIAVVALRESGVSKDDPRIRRAVEWLRSNQRQSGRWWTKSLNTDNWQFITYSGTAYPLLALALCDAL